MPPYFILFPARDSNQRMLRGRAWIAGVILLVACALSELPKPGVLAAQTSPVAERSGARDFVEYWSAGRLFAEGGNPYSLVELLALQRTAGWTGAEPLVMWNPPWTLPLVLPFGWPGFATGQFFWLLFHVGLIIVSTHYLWRIYGKSTQQSRIPMLLAFTFVPTVFVLIIGQITPLVLAALTAFLYHEEKQNWLTGAALVILTIKPHLLYLFWIVFAFWLLERRAWRFILTAASLSAAAVILPLLFNPNIYFEYLGLYGASGVVKPMDWPAPTLRNVIRIFFEVDHGGLQLAPTALASAWAVYHWYRCKQTWRWHEQLPLLSMMSVTSSVFVWTYDQVMLLPAIIEAAAWLSQTPAPWHRFWTARLYIAINTCHLALRFWLPEELWYFWLAPALLINYLIFSWERKFTNE